jgi:hypothetical protein
MLRLGFLIALILAFSSTSVLAQSAKPLIPLVVNGERYFKLQWEAADRSGRPTVQGSIFNDYGVPAGKIRVLVDSLDAAGGVTAQTIGYVPGELMGGTRSYFEVPVPARAATYRVAIFQWEWMQSSGGDPRR